MERLSSCPLGGGGHTSPATISECLTAMRADQRYLTLKDRTNLTKMLLTGVESVLY